LERIKCKGAITDGKGNFKIDEIEVFEPAAGEVLVKMKAAGICHTDYKESKRIIEWQRSRLCF